jgi:hypothetical protein
MNQIKTIGLPTGKWLFVTVSKESIRHDIKDGLLIWTDPIYDKSKQVDNTGNILLPVGAEYTLIGKADKLNMDQIYDLIKGSKYSLNKLCEEYNIDKSTIVIIKQED